MKKVYFAALLLLPLFAVPARAQCCCPWFPFRIEAGANAYLRVYGGPCQTWGCQLGPWYQYFPYEAHFQSAAPIGFPYWPSPQTLPPTAPAGAFHYQPAPPPQPAPTAAPPQQLQPTGYQPPFFQQVGYYNRAPSYWYER
jgi:hypothetical protein